MAQNFTCIGQIRLHETRSPVIHSPEIFIKKLQGNAWIITVYAHDHIYPFLLGLEGDGNELLWPCYSPEDSSFKLKADLIPSH